jgi:predicted PurR-regulated permease PerM
MKNSTNINLKALLPQLKRLWQIILRHMVFIVVTIILVVYIFVVWQINQLANAGPSDTAQTTAQTTTGVPRIDKTAIQQIQNLEQTNTQVQSLFEQARNNPFQE